MPPYLFDINKVLRKPKPSQKKIFLKKKFKCQMVSLMKILKNDKEGSKYGKKRAKNER